MIYNLSSDSEDRDFDQDGWSNRGATTEDDGEDFRAQQRQIFLNNQVSCAQPRDDDEVEPPLEQICTIFGVEGILQAFKGSKPRARAPRSSHATPSAFGSRWGVRPSPMRQARTSRTAIRCAVVAASATTETWSSFSRTTARTSPRDESAEEEAEESDRMIDDTDTEEDYAEFAQMMARQAARKVARAEKKAAKAAKKAAKRAKKA